MTREERVKRYRDISKQADALALAGRKGMVIPKLEAEFNKRDRGDTEKVVKITR